MDDATVFHEKSQFVSPEIRNLGNPGKALTSDFIHLQKTIQTSLDHAVSDLRIEPDGILQTSLERQSFLPIILGKEGSSKSSLLKNDKKSLLTKLLYLET